MEFKNLMEEIVLEALDSVWEKEDMCKCNQCRLDIVTKALNSLPPRYVATTRGKIYSRTDFLELQKNVDVLAAISEAIKTVKNNPHH